MALSTVDQSFVDSMKANHQTGIDQAMSYLAKPAGQRLATLSDMARNVITEHRAFLAKMATMTRDATKMK